MDRDPTSSSDTKSGSCSDGGNRGRPGRISGICGFRILDVQNLHGCGDGTDQGPDPVVVVKVEPEPTDCSPSQNAYRKLEVKPELFEGCSSQDPVVVLKVEPEPTDGSPSQDDNGALEVKSERFDDCSSQDRSTPILRTLAFTKKSLQQHKRSRSVKLKDCKQKCRRGQHFTMSKRNLTAEMVLELLDSEHILDTDEESGCSELDHRDNKLDADIAHPSPQYLQTTSASEDVQLLESCSGEDSDPESEEEPGDNAQETIRTSRNGTNWGENPPLQQRTPRHNIMRNPPGPAPGNAPRSPKHAWDLFVTDNMLEEICKCSNLEGQRAAANKKKVWKDISKNEILAFLGVSLLAGYDKSCDVSIRELFGDRVSNPMYRATMSVERFEDIRRCLRFDDRTTRDFRLLTDCMAAFRHVWDLFLENCRKRFVPHECVMVDEQLVPFRGRCKFIQYVPSKPAKYGIKIFWLCDSKTSYALDGIAYMGKRPGQEAQRNLGLNIVQQLSSTLRNTGRNITTDSFFTSVPLAKALLEKRLTLVGMLRQNSPDIPALMKPCKKRQLYSAEFGFKDNITIVSYVPKKDKTVILLSTLHHDKSVVEESRKKKPEIITYYNSTKGGINVMDQMVRTYSCKRQTRRWPMVMWYNVLDVAALNAFVLYKSQRPEFMQCVTYKRRSFLKELAQELVTPHMQSRLQANPRLPKNIVSSMEIFGVTQQQLQLACRHEQGPQKKRRCYCCPSNRDRKSSMLCKECEQHVCKEHSHVVCEKCFLGHFH